MSISMKCVVVAAFFATFCLGGVDHQFIHHHYVGRQASSSASYDTTPAAPTFSGSPSNCNKWHTIVKGDDCDTVSAAFGITRQQFLAWNPAVSQDCSTNFWLGEAYCVGVGNAPVSSTSKSPSNSPSSASTTSRPSSSSVSGSSSKSSDTSTYSVRNPITSYNLTSTTVGTAWPPEKTQAGQAANCNRWHLVGAADTCQTIIATYGGATISKSFYTWNPAVGTDCSGLYFQWWVCVGVQPTATYSLSIDTNDTTVTVPSHDPYQPTAFPTINSSFVPAPTQPGVASDCKGWYFAAANDTCSGILKEFGYLSMSDFVKFNPAVKSDCSGLWANTFYCIYDYDDSDTPLPPTVSSAPSPVQSGITSNCNSWYQATVGDDCDVIPQMFGTFSKSDFQTWNPAVKSDCSGLQDGSWYCVAVPGTPKTRTTAVPTTTFTTGTGEPSAVSPTAGTSVSVTRPITTLSSTSAGPVSTPTPTQAGMVAGCRRFYLAQSGDGCYDIAAAAGIALDDFYTWNPNVGNDCSGLWLNYYYCIGVAGPTTVISSGPPVAATGTVAQTSTASR